MARIVIRNLAKTYGRVQAVADFSLEVANGEFVSLLGPSGCGKTSTLRMVAGLEVPTGGEILIGDRPVSVPAQGILVAPEARRLGMVFQSYAVWPHMTVRENVAFPLRMLRVPPGEREERTAAVLGLVKLDGYGLRYPHELSGGQQQRVALARALVMEPEGLLLDEPLSNLDAKLREEMRFEIRELQARTRVTVLYVTHDQAEAMVLSDRVVVMDAGRTQQVGSPADIYLRPATPFLAGFVGLTNLLRGTVARREGRGCTVILDGGDAETVLLCEGIQDLARATLVSLRPEDIEVATVGPGIPGTVLGTAFLGDRVDCRIRLGNQEARAYAPARTDLAPGRAVWLRCGHAIAFPAGTSGAATTP
jgi:iron(III) transport system ATP-binding protein